MNQTTLRPFRFLRQSTPLATLLTVAAVGATSTAQAAPRSSSEYVALERDNVQRAVAALKQDPALAQRKAAGPVLQQAESALRTGSLASLNAAVGPKVLVGGKEFQLQSAYQGLAEFGANLRAREDRDNLLRYYELAHAVASPSALQNHVTVNQFASLSTSGMQMELDSVLTDAVLDSALANLMGYATPPTAAECALEKGYESGTDGTNGTCSAYAANGIMRNIDFALRDDLTCVRSQGRRGTCTAFGAVAAMESAVHVLNGNKINLSEQHAYWYGETTVGFSGRYTYGLNTLDFLQAVRDSGYQVPKEKIWNYNPSWSRDDLSGNTYEHSCDGYSGEKCTDFAFQGDEVVILGFHTHPNPMPNAGANGLAEATSLGVAPGNLDFAKLLLASEYPVVVALDVTSSFRNPNADGYITYVANETVDGGHALEVAGWVDNAELPAGAPLGSGGGYFVLKNSWGEAAGDCGYYYAPYDYLVSYARSLTSIIVN